MGIDLSLHSIEVFLLAVLFLAILSDVLLELFSVRLSLSTGRLQSWCFENFGQNLFYDFLISILFQFVSFRKKSFFVQMASLVNVGSFYNKQIAVLLLGSFIGMGLSVGIIAFFPFLVAVVFLLMSATLSFSTREHWKDLSVAFLALGLFLAFIYLFDIYISENSMNIYDYKFPETLFFAALGVATLFFKTPLPFILVLSGFLLVLPINVIWLPILYFLHQILSADRFYWYFFEKRTRLSFTLSWHLVLQFLHFSISMVLVYVLKQQGFIILPKGISFSQSFALCTLFYGLYLIVPSLLMTPALFLLTLTSVFQDRKNKPENQKIINAGERGQYFSIHLSLFLLRQEFKKFVATVHTVFKISREIGEGQDQVNQKFAQYRQVLQRVGEELKELCFCIGRQRSYRWQVKEVMSYYKVVNQMELLIEDLNYVIEVLQKQEVSEEWEKECRFWLGIQLKLFEIFFEESLGVEDSDMEKLRHNIERSYEILGRLFGDDTGMRPQHLASQTFYRVTESIANLSLQKN